MLEIGNKQYRNKEWLEKKYAKEELSTYKIGSICGRDNKTIWYWLNKFDIQTRTRSKAIHLIRGNHCEISKVAFEFINGELLGDGCLQSLSSYSALFAYGSQYLEYIKYVSNILKSFGINQTGKINKRQYKNANYHTYHYSSLCYKELLPVYKQWYPKSKKIVPKNIELTPLTVRQWYIGDGSLVHGKYGRPFIVLAADDFSISDTNRLVEQLINLGFKTTKYRYRNVIYISTHSTKNFLNYIGKCPVKCYQYKWTY